jgi:hypothetical protein
MALYTPGPLAGQISGRVGASIFSHNRGGTYIRNGTIPKKVLSPAAIAAKARLTVISRLWASVATDDRTAWATWAATNPITNRLGGKSVLAPHMAYMELNARLDRGSFSMISVPPVTAAPAPLTSLSLACAAGAGTAVLTTAPTPLGATLALWVEAAVTDNPTQTYLENIWKTVQVSAINQATGLDISADLENRFGSMIEDQIVHIRVSVLDSLSGLLSGPLYAEDVVAA